MFLWKSTNRIAFRTDLYYNSSEIYLEELFFTLIVNFFCAVHSDVTEKEWLALNGNVEIFLFKAYLPDADGLPTNKKGRRVSEAARNFVKMYVSQLTGMRYDSLIISAGSNGKPYIDNCGVHFNLSHCGNIVLAAFSDEEIGVDVELASRSGNAVIERIFTRGERDYIGLARSEPEARRRFCEIWTAKEAFMKLQGAGLLGRMDFDTADASSPLPVIRSPKWGDAEVFRRRVTLSLGEHDFIPRRKDDEVLGEAEFEICVCGSHVANADFQVMD